MAKRLIAAVGAGSIAFALCSTSFAFGCRIVDTGLTAKANGIVIGLLFSIAIAVWGIFALLLWGMPQKG